MAKPEQYKGDDAVAVKCLRDYTISGGSGPGAEDVEFKAGQTYSLSPRSAAHMLRQTYREFAKPKPGQKRGVYIGDANFFVDPKADKAQADADADAKAEKAKPTKADDDKKAKADS